MAKQTGPRKEKIMFGGKEVKELYEDKKLKTYYWWEIVNNKKKRKTCRVKKEAVRKIEAYKASLVESTKVPIKTAIVTETTEYTEEFAESPVDYMPGGKYEGEPEPAGFEYGRYQTFDTVPHTWLIEQFKRLLTEDPVQLAKETGVEELAYLADIKPPALNKIPLTKIIEFYLNRHLYRPEPKLTKDQYNYAKQVWEAFIKIIKVSYINDITPELINKYNSELLKVSRNIKHRPSWLNQNQKKLLKSKNPSAKWVKDRLSLTKGIINYYFKAEPNHQVVAEVVKNCTDLFYHDSVTKPIVKQVFEPKHLQAILNHCNQITDNPTVERFHKQWKAIVLLSLNCAFTLGDIRELTFDDIDLKKNELAMIRQKTGIERYAVLWGRTVNAINDYLTVRPKTKLNNVFVSKNGTKFVKTSITKSWQKLIDEINKDKVIVPTELTFKFWRKAASSSADRCTTANPNEVNYLRGHSNGIADHYTYRAADLVKNVCAKIEQDFFGNK